MAFYRDDEQDESKGDATAATTGASSGVINAGSAGGASNAPQQAQAQAQASSPSPDKTNFVGISKYLDANKAQAAKLGDQTAGVINNSADQARSSVNDLNSAASTAIKPVASLGTDILGRLNSTPEALSDAEKAQIKNTESAKYSGPQSAADLGAAYTNASQATKTAAENIDNSGTEQGRMNLISQINSAPRTQGINLFDNALVQTGDGRQKIADAATSNAGVKSGVTDATNAIQNQITGAQTQTSQAAKDSTDAVQAALNSWKQGFAPKVTNAQQALSSEQKAVTDDIGDPNNKYQLDPQTLQLLGLKPDDRTFGLDLNSYLNPASATDINANNVASPEDYARYSALSDLAGGDTANILDPNKAGLAGTAPKLSANTTQLQNDIAAKQASYDKVYNTQQGGFLDNGLMGFAHPAAYNTLQAIGPITLDKYAKQFNYNGPLDVNQATPAQVENFFMPMFADLDSQTRSLGRFDPYSNKSSYLMPGQPNTVWGSFYDGLAGSLAKLKGNMNYNSQVNASNPPPTYASGIYSTPARTGKQV